jgi:hypothetical protein
MSLKKLSVFELIPYRAFFRRKKLTKVELCEGLVEIGEDAFTYCGRSITKINIPNSLLRIGDWAFAGSLRCSVHLNDGIESIGEPRIRYSCIFTNFRVPPLITVIPVSMLYNCNSTFSVKISEDVTEIRSYAFRYCHCLRNVAFPPDAVIGYDILPDATDLLQLFGSELEIYKRIEASI